jgi:hypothetical protein
MLNFIPYLFNPLIIFVKSPIQPLQTTSRCFHHPHSQRKSRHHCHTAHRRARRTNHLLGSHTSGSTHPFEQTWMDVPDPGPPSLEPIYTNDEGRHGITCRQAWWSRRLHATCYSPTVSIPEGQAATCRPVHRLPCWSLQTTVAARWSRSYAPSSPPPSLFGLCANTGVGGK